ncbi:3-keto-5-aminohexanoate cleavage protein [Aurantimonas sp. MSK8Z-1]|uniref:3-keto-5-aminohexanoate cleavage protein n=1 Tax=Mangrovibrevibacter kandeliae TaxID=2968473 RepID=UPI0021184BB8|nr:3-keto-5-aminohexanoate cleavage protein [Aurantimonas sp. MSK8Z-1]MCW4116244.1 3-keto-5-aminohexanoate cleavage protein [Aurantimonas sp. MSK8Z-1]
MIVQACINGARASDYHPKLPLTPAAMAADAAACVAAGAAELHLHARRGGRESLRAVSETVRAVRAACPGTLIGASTGAWIEGSPQATLDAIDGWTDLPDHASVNLSEPDAPAVMARLRDKGVAIEAGLASVADARRLASLQPPMHPLRVLVELEEQDAATALAAADAILDVLAEAGLRRPILLHGFDATVWPLARHAFQRGLSTRVGLEDGQHLPDGSLAPDNAAILRAAMALRAEVLERRP